MSTPPNPDVYHAADDRYDPADHTAMPYRRSGDSGLKLPAVTLGLWHNFGGDRPLETQRAILRRAFDRGVTHFDLANNYGPPPGSAEENVGRLLARDFRPYRDELIISSKAGWYMHGGPYGFGGSRKYIVASCDASLRRMGLDYVDIFYHHRPDPETPVEETVAALDHLVRSGRALYVGVSSYSPELTRRAQAVARDLGTPLTIHQPSYSMFNRWTEGPDGPSDPGQIPAARESLLRTCADEGMGVIAFSALAQGLLTDRYFHGVPEDSRLGAEKMNPDFLTDDTLAAVRGLTDIAAARGQSLAQMAIAWVLRRPEVTSALIGASSVEQLDDSLSALDRLSFDDDELAAIDRFAVDRGINQWQGATDSAGE
ncbi:aldo/keto reductase [Corynebacterium bovis]|uniref:aldo/keto reductase n=1 Tax=Corynebacterium bovis TaxID=36808 RepID=UPI000F64FA58|nr:aldo/keto reductase [Corynebacterium bovis]RRO79733.1 aldo/keto reductase [Corynebacterium bovis]RRO81122.1 aldo/keto reductase [Corynebacterium bovis]RRO82772.1 aldo/keto reductase [Corynebacterium bovis]RRO90971.1 aldo/keto reductase [Corynebacterium bovis]